MHVKYELLTFDPVNWAVTVRFFVDGIDQDFVFNVDIPYENGTFIGEEQFKAHIELMLPVQHFERVLAVKDAVVPPYLAALPVPRRETVSQPKDIGVTIL